MDYAYIVFLAVFAAAIAADLYDIRLSLKGIKKGVGVEGTGYIRALAGTDKPTFWQYLWINMLIPILPIGIPGLIFSYQNTPGAVFFSICLAFQVYSHIRGGRNWTYLINGGAPNKLEQKWWQKLLSI